MNVFFDQVCINNDLRVYIHCFSAIDHAKVSKRLHNHTEYDTPWSDSLYNWQKKDYFKHIRTEELIGNNETVIFVLTFMDGSDGYSNLIKELNTYLHDDNFNYGAYYITYRSHDVINQPIKTII